MYNISHNSKESHKIGVKYISQDLKVNKDKGTGQNLNCPTSTDLFRNFYTLFYYCAENVLNINTNNYVAHL